VGKEKKKASLSRRRKGPKTKERKTTKCTIEKDRDLQRGRKLLRRDSRNKKLRRGGLQVAESRDKKKKKSVCKGKKGTERNSLLTEIGEEPKGKSGYGSGKGREKCYFIGRGGKGEGRIKKKPPKTGEAFPVRDPKVRKL